MLKCLTLNKIYIFILLLNFIGHNTEVRLNNVCENYKTLNFIYFDSQMMNYFRIVFLFLFKLNININEINKINF